MLSVFRDAGVNLLAFHAFPSARRTQLDFVPQDGAAFVAAAKAAKIKLSKPTDTGMSTPLHHLPPVRLTFLEPLGLTQYRLAKSLTVPPRRVNEIVHGKRAVTADTALRLARFFGTSERFWLNLQTSYDLEIERDRLGDRLRKDVQVWKKAG